VINASRSQKDSNVEAGFFRWLPPAALLFPFARTTLKRIRLYPASWGGSIFFSPVRYILSNHEWVCFNCTGRQSIWFLGSLSKFHAWFFRGESF
jgi:hypothetical protein